jgi:ribosomal protein S13
MENVTTQDWSDLLLAMSDLGFILEVYLIAFCAITLGLIFIKIILETVTESRRIQRWNSISNPNNNNSSSEQTQEVVMDDKNNDNNNNKLVFGLSYILGICTLNADQLVTAAEHDVQVIWNLRKKIAEIKEAFVSRITAIKRGFGEKKEQFQTWMDKMRLEGEASRLNRQVEREALLKAKAEAAALKVHPLQRMVSWLLTEHRRQQRLDAASATSKVESSVDLEQVLGKVFEDVRERIDAVEVAVEEYSEEVISVPEAMTLELRVTVEVLIKEAEEMLLQDRHGALEILRNSEIAKKYQVPTNLNFICTRAAILRLIA